MQPLGCVQAAITQMECNAPKMVRSNRTWACEQDMRKLYLLLLVTPVEDVKCHAEPVQHPKHHQMLSPMSVMA